MNNYDKSYEYNLSKIGKEYDYLLKQKKQKQQKEKHKKYKNSKEYKIKRIKDEIKEILKKKQLDEIKKSDFLKKYIKDNFNNSYEWVNINNKQVFVCKYEDKINKTKYSYDELLFKYLLERQQELDIENKNKNAELEMINNNQEDYNNKQQNKIGQIINNGTTKCQQIKQEIEKIQEHKEQKIEEYRDDLYEYDLQNENKSQNSKNTFHIDEYWMAIEAIDCNNKQIDKIKKLQSIENKITDDVGQIETTIAKYNKNMKKQKDYIRKNLSDIIDEQKNLKNIDKKILNELKEKKKQLYNLQNGKIKNKNKLINTKQYKRIPLTRDDM